MLEGEGWYESFLNRSIYLFFNELHIINGIWDCNIKEWWSQLCMKQIRWLDSSTNLFFYACVRASSPWDEVSIRIWKNFDNQDKIKNFL
jgi:hypothetical protein